MQHAELVKKVESKLSVAVGTVQTKVAEYTLAAWQEVATGTEHHFYNGALPPQDGSYVKLWEQTVFQLTIATAIP